MFIDSNADNVIGLSSDDGSSYTVRLDFSQAVDFLDPIQGQTFLTMVLVLISLGRIMGRQ